MKPGMTLAQRRVLLVANPENHRQRLVRLTAPGARRGYYIQTVGDEDVAVRADLVRRLIRRRRLEVWASMIGVVYYRWTARGCGVATRRHRA